MKKIIQQLFKLAALLLILALPNACSKDFLEKPKGSDITIDTVFTNSTNAQQLIFMLYNNTYFNDPNIALNWWEAPNYWASWSELGEDLYSDDLFGGWSGAYAKGTVSTTTRQMYPMDNLYTAVRYANTFLQNASSINTSSDLDQQYVKYMIGEANAHLAYQYFKGMRVWGSIPWINRVLVGGEEPTPRPAFSDFVDSIVSRLDKAAELLPAKWEDKWTGRFTSVAAKALKAKVLAYAASALYNGPVPAYASGYEHPEYLGYGSFDAARCKRAADACKEAIDAAHTAGNALYTAAGIKKNIYTLAITLTNEHILYQRFKSTNSEGGWFYVHNMMNWPYGIGWYNRVEVTYQPTIQHVDRYQMINGKFPIDGYENGDPTKPIVSADGIAAGYDDQQYWKDRDPRLDQNIVRHGALFGEKYYNYPVNFDANKSLPHRNHGDWPGFKTSFMVRKFVNEALGESQSITYTPIHPMIRLADLYLLYAEMLSEYAGGPDAEALNYFNQVRARSGMPNYDEANYKGANAREKFHNAIRYEREVEFFLEGQRYFDLRRWKEAGDLAENMGGVRIYNGVVSRIDINWSRIWDDRLYFHPFYTDWVTKTPGLIQNPGW